MSIVSNEDFVQQLEISIGDLINEIDPDHLDFACKHALTELKWHLPLTSPGRVFWAIQRARRHCVEIVWFAASNEFRYKLIFLNQRFEHLTIVMKYMDELFERGLESDPDLCGVDGASLFGFYVKNSFVYDQYGNDVSKLFKQAGIDPGIHRQIHLM